MSSNGKLVLVLRQMISGIRWLLWFAKKSQKVKPFHLMKFFRLKNEIKCHQNVRVSQRQPIYSARVSISYRVLGLLESDHIYWYWIGAHDEYDELLKRI